MVAASRAAAGMGYVGYPAQIFYEKINFNRGPQLHIERLFILDKWYSDLRAYLPILFKADPELFPEESKDKIFYFDIILPKINEVDKKLLDAWELYKASFEGEQSFDPSELMFVKQLRAVLLDLDAITAISKVIDKQKMTEDMQEIG
jgi:hypothetical protein